MGGCCTLHRGQVANDPNGKDFDAIPNPLAVHTNQTTTRKEKITPTAEMKLDTSSQSMPFHLLPLPVKMVLVQLIDIPDLYKMMLVCSKWHSCLMDDQLWRMVSMLKPNKLPKCLLEATSHLPVMQQALMDFSRNLITNPSATSLSDHSKAWRICGGDAGPKMISIDDEFRGNGFKCWSTSHSKVHRKQVINLESLRFPVEILDKKDPPDLYVSEWFAGQNTSATFRIRVKLLGPWTNTKEPQPVIDTFDSKDQSPNPDKQGSFICVSNCFRNYPKGVRYICFEDWSKDCLLVKACVQFGVPPQEPDS